jgi:hypothetical protein
VADSKQARPSKVVGPDGLEWAADEDTRLDELALAAFGRGAGKEFLRYLRSITIELVAGPDITDAHLRHREGMRSLVAVIETRVNRGHKRRAKQ